MKEIQEEYEELRQKYLDGLSEKVYFPLEKARKRKLHIGWTKDMICRPQNMGVTYFKDYDMSQLVDYISWDPFFHTWKLRGKYLNREYSKIFNDKAWGEQAKELFEKVQVMLTRIVSEKLIKGRAVIAFYPCNSVNDDDIELYDENDNNKVIGKLFTMRQQQETENRVYLALSDFIAPKETGITDYIGMFACSAGFGQDELVSKFEEDHDDFSIIMLKALTDRLAEAMAEKLHEDVRKEYWGYAPHENLSKKELIYAKYQGIRPAPGYPSQPDHTEKRLMWDLLKVNEEIGISLTESFAIEPASSVSGLYFTHPKSEYFAVGEINEDQMASYAERKSFTKDEAELWLSSNLSYK